MRIVTWNRWYIAASRSSRTNSVVLESGSARTQSGGPLFKSTRVPERILFVRQSLAHAHLHRGAALRRSRTVGIESADMCSAILLDDSAPRRGSHQARSGMSPSSTSQSSSSPSLLTSARMLRLPLYRPMVQPQLRGLVSFLTVMKLTPGCCGTRPPINLCSSSTATSRASSSAVTRTHGRRRLRGICGTSTFPSCGAAREAAQCTM